MKERVEDINTGHKKGFNLKYTIINDYVILNVKRKIDGVKLESYIDYEDLKRLIKWNISWNAVWAKNVQNYYLKATEYLGTINGKAKYKIHCLHRYVVEAKDGTRVDHKNHNALDNRKGNLRATNDDKNTKNRKSKNSNNKSGFRNVSWNGNTWSVQLQIEGVNTILKRFKKNQLEEAGAYAEEMRQLYYGDFAGKS